MIVRNIDELIKTISTIVEKHKISEGRYSRYLWNNEKVNRKMGINEYGCADAANILYSIGEFEGDPAKRAEWIKALQEMQHPDTGIFEEGTHHIIHTTAHCISALELFDAKPLYPVKEFEKYKNTDELYKLLDNLLWKERCWPQSHQGAGIFAIFAVMEMADLDWQDAYFSWLDKEADPETGLWRKGHMPEGMEFYTTIGCAFHYVFNYEHANRPLPYPERIIDTCINMYRNKDNGGFGRYDFGHNVQFFEMDFVYLVTRSLAQTGYRYNECIDMLKEFSDDFIDMLYSLDPDTHDGMNDIHMLFGTVCCLAELQQALRGHVVSTKPLKLVLDRRPFI
ncbi:MAG: hypothetical protein IJ365_01150 [Clostridia bacterium]|nr:hypothetical protein [Clostridia bacterium]